MQKLLFPDSETAPNITLSDNGSCFETIWEDGTFINTQEHDLSRLEFICEDLPSGEMTEFAVSDMGCLIVSQRLKNAFVKYGINNIDFFPATIIERTGEQPKAGFYAANIIGLVACINTDESEFRGRVVDGELKGIRRITKLVLDNPEPIASYIYRVYLFRRLIVLSGNALKLFGENNFSGVKIVEPSRWDGFAGEK